MYFNYSACSYLWNEVNNFHHFFFKMVKMVEHTHTRNITYPNTKVILKDYITHDVLLYYILMSPLFFFAQYVKGKLSTSNHFNFDEICPLQR